MPCSSSEGMGESLEWHNLRAERHQHSKTTAALCAILTHFEDRDIFIGVLDALDWKEAGVTRSWVEGWWAEHKIEDAERRANEARTREQIRNDMKMTHGYTELDLGD